MKKVSSILGKHRHWLSRSPVVVAQELEFLDEDLASDSLLGFDNVSDSLGMLAVHYGIQGEVAIFDGDETGWENVARSMMYRYWALMLKARSFSNTRFLQGIKTVPDLSNHLSHAACLLAAFMAADRRDLASSTADVLAGMLSVPGAVDARFMKARHFEPFMLWLYSVYSQQGAVAQIESMNLGIYQSVIDNWNDEQQLAVVLEELGRYHLANAQDNGGAWKPEFKSPPFDLLLVEVGAIYRARQQLGLPSPTVTNPLLYVGTAASRHLVFSPDELVVRVESAYRRFFGGT
ncbi:hypothetical protein RGV33_00805 [Pseudomonas sp. Bout1]|uniref:hypothetical protein n=1 Tax=Pseudomonas sp. Bout1 TaxID=3048600 RepID=UPI002AB59813|nr:hypothetical protein [Pseudomonas sp. Bout1]MDY7530233.1 hypothetical protein [Pseudomonas sp. Bout1]MEB0185694.1 hypothetical protein [Pseudomonas sp. Bout1]